MKIGEIVLFLFFVLEMLPFGLYVSFPMLARVAAALFMVLTLGFYCVVVPCVISFGAVFLLAPVLIVLYEIRVALPVSVVVIASTFIASLIILAVSIVVFMARSMSISVSSISLMFVTPTITPTPTIAVVMFITVVATRIGWWLRSVGILLRRSVVCVDRWIGRHYRGRCRCGCHRLRMFWV